MTKQELHELLYGTDPTERLVALYLDYSNVKTEKWNTINMVFRHEDDSVETREAVYHPMLYASEQCLREFKRMEGMFAKVLEVDGPGKFNRLVRFHTYKAYRKFTQEIRDTRPDNFWSYWKQFGTVETQFLIGRGMTMFKGMEFNDMLRMAVDIEVYSPDGFPNPDRADAPIIMIGCKDNRGRCIVFHTHPNMPHVEHTHYCHDEQEMLRKFVRYVRRINPDVIEGHNIYKFDLPFIAKRCKLHGVKTKLGRDDSELRFWWTKFRAAEKDIAYPATDIRGRHIIDTYFAALSQDVFRRNMEQYGLKYLAKYFGVARSEEAELAGDKIAETWDKDPLKLSQYIVADLDETLAISEELSAANFYLTQMVPHSYSKVARSGQSAKIEPLFIRHYFNKRHALPAPEEGFQESGGYADIFYRGVVGPIMYADVESLYPSIMLNYNIQPESDDLKIFQPLLRELTKLRFDWKDQMRKYEKGSNEYRKYEGMQSSAKIVINAFYGNLSTKSFAFNDYSEGERVATTGQTLLKQLIGIIEEDGGVVIECDTDGVMFLPPDFVEIGNDKSEKGYIQTLTKRMPEGIVVGHDGTYDRMISFRTKNYVLRESPGKEPKFKGSAIISRGNEKFVNRFVRQAFTLLLDEDIQGIRDLLLEYRRKLLQKKLPISDLTATKTLKKTYDQYVADVEKLNRNRMPQYEVAGHLIFDLGRQVQPGDRITYYVQGGHGKGVRVWQKAKWVGEYDNDEDITYYLSRLDAALKKLEPMFDRFDYNTLTEINVGLFPVDLSKVTVPFVNVKEEGDD